MKVAGTLAYSNRTLSEKLDLIRNVIMYIDDASSRAQLSLQSERASKKC